jgi:hypothetical protein
MSIVSSALDWFSQFLQEAGNEDAMPPLTNFIPRGELQQFIPWNVL